MDTLNQKILILLKEFKFKINEETQSDDFIDFYKGRFNFWVQLESVEDLQYSIGGIDNTEIDESYFCDRFIESGNIDDFEEFLYAINDGNFTYLDKMHKSITKLRDTFEEHDDDLLAMIREIIY